MARRILALALMTAGIALILGMFLVLGEARMEEGVVVAVGMSLGALLVLLGVAIEPPPNEGR